MEYEAVAAFPKNSETIVASKKAQHYITKKIEKVMKEGNAKSSKQAVAIAYSYARKKGYKVGKKK